MRQILAITRKEFLLWAQKPGSWIIVFIVPFLFIWIIQAVFGSTGTPVVTVFAVNEDAGAASAQALQALEQNPNLKVDELETREEADRRVGAGERMAAIIIPAGFSDAVQTPGGAKIEIIVDPARSEQANIVVGLANAALAPMMVDAEVSRGVESSVQQLVSSVSEALMTSTAQAEGTGSVTPTGQPGEQATPTEDLSTSVPVETPTVTQAVALQPSPTKSMTPTAQATVTRSPTVSAQTTTTGTVTAGAQTNTPTPTRTGSVTPGALTTTPTPTGTGSVTPAAQSTATATKTMTQTPAAQATGTSTPNISLTLTAQVSRTPRLTLAPTKTTQPSGGAGGGFTNANPLSMYRFLTSAIKGVISSQVQDAIDNPKITLETVPAGGAARKPSLLDYLVPGYSLMFVFFLISNLAVTVVEERQTGTLNRLLIAPVTRSQLLLGKMLPYFLIAVVQFIVVLGVSKLVFGLDLGSGVSGSTTGLALLITASAAAMAGLGILVAAFARTEGQADGMAIVLILAMAVISGAMFPSISIPGLKMITPHYWAIQGFLNVIARGQGLDGALGPTGILLIMASLFFTIGAIRFRFE